MYLGVLLGAFVCEFGQTYLMQYTGQLAMFDLRKQLMQHLQKLDLAFYDRNPVGRLVTRVTSDVDVLNDLFTSGLVTILGDVLVLALILAIMFRMSPPLAAVMLAAMPLVILATSIFRRTVAQSYRRIRIAIARINAYLQEHITGMAVLQLFNREARSRREFELVNREHMRAYKAAITAYGWFYPVVELVSTMALAGILIYGGFRVTSGRLTLGVVVAFLQYGLRFFRPIQDLSEKYNILQAAMASSERIFKLLDTEVELPSPAAPRSVPAAIAPIEFKHVWFAYQKEDWVLEDVSFTIAPGRTVAVVGHTGAGKTTLVSLLLRFYDVGRGAIRIGGTDVRDFDPQEFRRQFGVCAPYRRARGRPFHGPKAVDQLRPRPGAQPALPDSGRSHFQRGYRNGAARAGRSGAHGGGAHVDRDRASAIHRSAGRPHPGDAQGAPAGERNPSGAAGPARDLLEALPASVQGPGSADGSGQREARRLMHSASPIDA